jgi:hypothetical protein
MKTALMLLYQAGGKILLHRVMYQNHEIAAIS